jgi:hypothetical protein
MPALTHSHSVGVAESGCHRPAASFREVMSDFFGKAGMPWHGVMFIRRAHGSEQVAEGEFVVSYVDTMMKEKKEDGFATLSVLYTAIKAYKADHPWIEHASVKTDGAGAYARDPH